eukprot:GHRQ01011049.1.p1 GENE.GHRQ01011049.1~~GHRQ01011049.1.p1  ORF type:complete len:132 (+),score=41.92 GHRQ01011049.1:736-1131(+)
MQQCNIAYLRRMPWHVYSSSKNTLAVGPRGQLAVVVRSISNSSNNDGSAPICPTEPGPEDCCQSGCENCVWQVYNQELKRYMQYMQQHGHPVQQIAASRKAPKQQLVAASLDAFEQLERELQLQQQQQQHS